MTVREFLFAADALRQDEGVSFTMPTEPVGRPQPTPADNRARNDQAMAAFQSMMGGTQMRKRR